MKKLNLILILLVTATVIFCQPTVGLLQYGNGDYPGYVLMAPNSSNKTYLLDKCGYKVHEWNSTYVPGQSAYLLPDGSLLRTGRVNNSNFSGGGSGGIIERYNWNDSLIWSYLISTTSECQHHDIKPMPNGNVLALVWERKTANQVIARGRNPSLVNNIMWVEKIIEVQPTGPTTGNVVWQWTNWDHIIQDYDSTKPYFGVVADHPERFNFNYLNGNVTTDWMHFNGIDYDPVNDLIIMSSRRMCEVYVVDHSTTTAQATGHTGGNYGKGGDILYRYGNPMAYNRGTLADRKFYYQHCPTFIPQGYPQAGKIMVFNNGVNRPAGAFSTVDVIEPPVDASGNFIINTGQAFGPQNLYWSYTDPTPTNFYSGLISGAYKMENGNVFITSGQLGILFEVDSSGNKLWTYQNPITTNGPLSQGDTNITTTGVFKAQFYPLNYNAFSGQNLSPQGPLELNPINYNCAMTLGQNENENKILKNIYPNPVSDILTVKSNLSEKLFYAITDISGKTLLSGEFYSETSLNTSLLSPGVYFLKIKGKDSEETKRFVKY
jgi:Arylsulfotransferase (ASST)/Secretion system C-terminal sorting domain